MRQSAATDSGEVSYLHADHLGTVSAVTDDNTQVLARTLNLPYGGVRWQSGASPTDYGFTGEKDDSYIKLIQMGARWYDPAIGRWVSPDTIVPDPVNPQSLNRFAYVLNNPLRYTDPSGHRECSDIDCGGGGGVASAPPAPSGLEALAHLADSYANPAGTGNPEWIESVTGSSDEWLDEYRYAPNSDHYYHYCRHQNVWGFGCPGQNTVIDLTYLGVMQTQSGSGTSILMARPSRGADNEEPSPADIANLNPTINGLPVRPGQGDVDKSQVIKVAKSMLKRGYQGRPLRLVRDALGYVIDDGHHRFLASRLAGVEIPEYAIDVVRDVRPNVWIDSRWTDVIWSGR